MSPRSRGSRLGQFLICIATLNEGNLFIRKEMRVPAASNNCPYTGHSPQVSYSWYSGVFDAFTPTDSTCPPTS